MQTSFNYKYFSIVKYFIVCKDEIKSELCIKDTKNRIPQEYLDKKIIITEICIILSLPK